MKLIDISHALTRNTPVFPGDYKTSLTQYKTIENDAYNACLLKSGLHAGTHIDMPLHMVDERKTAKDYPLDCFCGRGVLIDARGEGTVKMKPAYEKILGGQDIVLLFTGFDEYYHEDRYFIDYPVPDHAFGQFLLSKKIKMLGMDTPGPDHEPYAFHRELLSRGIFVLENLTNLKSLIGVDRFDVIALPLKIDAEASLARAVCIVR